MTQSDLPLAGIKVAEFTHMVMGPACGLVLADMGADVVKIEPIGGDNTRHLPGSGAGYFPMYNRNKRSVCIDLKTAEGKEAALKLVADADVLVENFRPGTMDRLGFGYGDLAKLNPGLVYCSEKGFLAGPYEKRTALDEVAQMMGGLAYMTGPPGKPLRAGASVIDVQGGMFGALGVIAALYQRKATGKGQQVVSSLFENTVFLMGQHMAQQAVTGAPAKPMPVRISAWAVYEVFETGDDSQVFIGVVSDAQWRTFCEAFDLKELGSDESLDKNAERVNQRERILPIIRAALKGYPKQQLMQRLEQAGLPFAPITKPEDLFDDPHLNAGGGLLPITIPNGENAGAEARLPALPLEMNGERLGLFRDVPREGQHAREVLAELGYSSEQVAALIAGGVVGGE
jgi:crotonobetainyl-CoA:carnitine CoA-transferase CaiB-like acyl-CoA transferase